MELLSEPKNMIGKGQFMLSIEYLEVLLAFSSRYGVNPDFLFLGSDATLQDYLSRPKFVGNDTYNSLIDRLISVTDDPFLSFEFGLVLSQQAHGPVGLALRTCKTIEQFLNILPSLFATRLGYAQSIVFRKTKNAEELCLRSSAPTAPNHIVRFNTISVLTSLAWMLRNVTGTQDQCIKQEMRLTWPALDTEVPSSLLPSGMGIKFSQPENLLSSGRGWLGTRLISSSNALNEAALRQVQIEKSSPPEDMEIVDQVHWAFRVAHPEILDLSGVAELLRMSPATLKRKLRDSGSSFSLLKNEARFKRAQNLLLLTDQSLEEISHRVGYSDASNFSKAFRRYCGEAPGSYRERIRD